MVKSKILMLPSPPAVPEYRAPFVEGLANDFDLTVFVYPQEVTKLESVESSNYKLVVQRHRLLGRVISNWEILNCLLHGYRGIVVLYANINEPGVHLVGVVARLLGCPLVFWTQYRRADGCLGRDKVKMLWVRLMASLVWLYTDRELEQYGRRWWGAELVPLNNGLATTSAPCAVEPRWERGAFVFCARLIHKNRLDLLLKAFAQYCDNGGTRQLIVIGLGPDEKFLVDYRGLIERARLVVRGALPMREADEVIAGSFCMVHPFAIGLSIVSAFQKGIPLVAHSDAGRHMPEFWLFEEGQTGLGFSGETENGWVSSLANVLSRADAVSLDRYTEWSNRCVVRSKSASIEGMLCRAKASLQRLCCGHFSQRIESI